MTEKDAPKGVGEAELAALDAIASDEGDRFGLAERIARRGQLDIGQDPDEWINDHRRWEYALPDAFAAIDNDDAVAVPRAHLRALLAELRQARAATTAASPGGWDREVIVQLIVKTLRAEGEAMGAEVEDECPPELVAVFETVADAVLAASPQPPVQPGAVEAFLDLIADAEVWDEQQDEGGIYYHLEFTHHSLQPLLAALGIDVKYGETPAQAIDRVLDHLPAPPVTEGT